MLYINGEKHGERESPIEVDEKENVSLLRTLGANARARLLPVWRVYIHVYTRLGHCASTFSGTRGKWNRNDGDESMFGCIIVAVCVWVNLWVCQG